MLGNMIPQTEMICSYAKESKPVKGDSPHSKLKLGVLFVLAVVERHTAADDKGVLLNQWVWDAVRVAVYGVVARLTLCQAFKTNQRQHLVKPAQQCIVSCIENGDSVL